MGVAIADRLHLCEASVVGVDPFFSEMQGLSGTTATTPGGVPVESDLTAARLRINNAPTDVLVVVRTADQVEAVCEELADFGWLNQSRVAVLTTLTAASARGLYNKFGAGRHFAETPISGGVTGARHGALTIFTFGPVGEWIELVATTVMPFESPGAPATVKLLNNLLAAANVHALSYVLNVAEEMGVSASELFDVIAVSSGASWMSPYFESFPVDLLWKDVGLLDSEFKVDIPAFTAETEFSREIRLAREALQRGDDGNMPSRLTNVIHQAEDESN